MRLHAAGLVLTALFAISLGREANDNDNMGTVIGIDLGTTYSW